MLLWSDHSGLTIRGHLVAMIESACGRISCASMAERTMDMDNLGVLALLALAPILVVGILLAGLRWPAKYAMPVGYVVAVIVALWVWKMDFNGVLAAS